MGECGPVWPDWGGRVRTCWKMFACFLCVARCCIMIHLWCDSYVRDDIGR